jgi:hypothetical protein
MQSRGWCYATIVGLALTLSTAELSHARTYGGVDFPESVTIEDQRLPLRGVGRVYYLRFFELYVGGLYISESVSSEDVLSDVPKRLELHYVRKITSAQLIEGAVDFMDRNLSKEQLRLIAPRMEQLNRAYRDVKDGDSYALTYVPGVGTELALNGTPLVTIEGADFAAAYLSIWLGSRSLSASFREAVTTVDLAD